MYGMFTYIYHKTQPNVGKSTIHGSCGGIMIRNNFMFANACKIKRHFQAHFLYLALMVFGTNYLQGPS